MHIRPVDPEAIMAQTLIPLPSQQSEQEKSIPPPVEANADEKVILTRRSADARAGKKRRNGPGLATEGAEDEADSGANTVIYTADGQVEACGVPAGEHRLDLSI